MKTFDEVCRSIDWPVLAKQKQTLLIIQSYLDGNVTNDEDDMNVKAFLRSLKRHSKNIQGLINFFDALQDSAVDVHGVDELEVYPSLKKIRNA